MMRILVSDDVSEKGVALLRDLELRPLCKNLFQ